MAPLLPATASAATCPARRQQPAASLPPAPLLPPPCRPQPQYATHLPLNPVEKGAVALLSLWGAFRNPGRGDLVAASGETTGLPALLAMRERMRRSDTGRLILQERPLITVGCLPLHCRRPFSAGPGCTPMTIAAPPCPRHQLQARPQPPAAPAFPASVFAPAPLQLPAGRGGGALLGHA